MPRLTIEDLKRIKEESARSLTIRSGVGRARVTVHMGDCGIAAGAREVMAALMREAEAQGVTDVILAASGCAGQCSLEPTVTVEVAGEPPVRYVEMSPAKAAVVFRRHVLGGRTVAEYAAGGAARRPALWKE